MLVCMIWPHAPEHIVPIQNAMNICQLWCCLLAAEKNLKAIKTIMKDLPSNTRLAFVGDGPERAALQQHYADMPNVKFMVSYAACGPCMVLYPITHLLLL